MLLLVVDSARADGPRVVLGGDVEFQKAYAPAAYTSQSVAALLTGRLPSSGGSIGLLEAEAAERASTLPQRFRRAGYRTGVASNQGLLSRRGFTRGFEDIQVASLAQNWPAEEVSRRALDFIDSVAGQPWFLYVHYADPHQPYDPPARFLDRLDMPEVEGEVSVAGLQRVIESEGRLAESDPRLRALVLRYQAEVAAVDAALEQLLTSLEEREQLEDTVVVLTASQGEELGEHGWLGHAWTLYEEVVRVPLRLRIPGLGAQAIDTPVSLVDLAPSLLTIAGLPYDEAQVDGESLVVVGDSGLRLRPPTRTKITELVIRERCILRAAIDGEWKYIQTLVDCPIGERRSIAAAYPERVRAMSEGSMATPELWGEPVREELYHLGRDPGETENLAEAEPVVLARLRRVLDNYAVHCRESGLAAAKAVVAAEMADPATVERLQSLGYL